MVIMVTMAMIMMDIIIVKPRVLWESLGRQAPPLGRVALLFQNRSYLGGHLGGQA